MLCAIRQRDQVSVIAADEVRENSPFTCPECKDPVILRKYRTKNYTDNFAHKPPVTCDYGKGETEIHRRCKMELWSGLQEAFGNDSVKMEQPLGICRPDILFQTKTATVAVEVQFSRLSLEEITRRTRQYHERNIHVIWLPPYHEKLAEKEYRPRLWERWLHAMQFGRVYYWRCGLNISAFHFDPFIRKIPVRSWYEPGGIEATAGGGERRLKATKVPIHVRDLNLAKDFTPRSRESAEMGLFTLPSAKLWLERR